MSAQSVVIWYESGSCEEITAPDLSFEAGYVIQSEYVDVSDIDRGIWWERTCVYQSPEGDAGEEAEADAMRYVHRSVCVATPDALSRAVLVEVHGQTVFERDDTAGTKCGLKNILTSIKPDNDFQKGTADEIAGVEDN